jgi:NADP-dependent 3-hydroxy acid dehydrogenase YdfG
MGMPGIQERVVVITAKLFARAVAYAIEQPADVEIDEIVVRPTAQDF